MEPTTKSPVTSTATEDERRRVNADLPINRLPPELLSYIFQGGPRKRYYRGLFAIRSVCKYWLEIVDSAPDLWAFVSSEHNDQLLDMIFQKSKNYPLSIEYDNGVSTFTAAAFRKRVHPIASRWKWLDCHAYGAALGRVLRLQLQNLETLKARVHEAPTHCSFPLQAPKLRYVTLQGLSLKWESLSDLRSLIIARPTIEPSINQVHLLFTNCPRLEVFRIDGDASSALPHDDRNVALPTAPVFLPHLQHLLLSDVQVAPYTHLLSLIDTPSLRSLFCSRTFWYFETNRSPMFQPVERFFMSYAHSLNNDYDHTQLRISGSRYNFTISLGICKIVFRGYSWRWRGYGYDYPAELSAALSRLDGRISDNIKAIHFGGARSREDLIILGPIFQRHFPNVEELVVTLSSEVGRQDAQFVLEQLASQVLLEDGSVWLFPRLTTLRIKACREPMCDGVLGVVEARRIGGVHAIQRVSIKSGRIGRDTAAKLKACLQDFCTAGTRYVDTGSGEA